jgi:hypothetical protein
LLTQPDRGDLLRKGRRSFGRAGRLRGGEYEHPGCRETLGVECVGAGCDGIAVFSEEAADRPEIGLERNDVPVLLVHDDGRASARGKRRLPDRRIEGVVHGELGRRRGLSLAGRLRAGGGCEEEG